MNEETKIKIEIFCAPNCNRCNATTELVKTIINERPNFFQYEKIDVVEEIDYAIELGIRATPSIAINGTLVFTRCPSKHTLETHLLSLIKKT